MFRSIFTSVLAVLMLLLSTATAHAQQQAPLGVIAIDWGYEQADAPRRNPELIYKTLKAAFADTLKKKLNVENPATVADLELMNDGRNIRLVIISKGAVQPTADEVMAMVKDSFMDVVNNFFNDYHAREIAQLRDVDLIQLDQVRRRATQAQDQLAKLRGNLRSITHRVDVSPETLRGAITRLEDERDKLALDTESMKVRRKAIEDTIAEITAKTAEQMKKDRVAVELEKLIVSRETEVKRMQQLAAENNVSAAQLEESQGRLGEARVRLWERQEIVNRTAGGEVLADLNKELAMLSINSFESEHRLKRLQSAVDDYAKAVDYIDELENAQAARATAQQQVVEAENFANEHGRSLRTLPPPTVNLHWRGPQGQ
jgi:hypothetical protein